MMDQSREIEKLRNRIESLEKENAELKRNPRRTNEESTDSVKQANHDVPSIFNSLQDELTPEQIERYSRQLLISGGFGVQGQLKLLQSRVLVIGAGGIGSAVLLYLAASGIGRMTIVDFDEVDISNLHRQVIHKSYDVGMNKAESARNAVLALNPSIQCNIIRMPVTSSNALELVMEHDCVVDASDNPQTRYLINDACVIGNKPLVSGSAIGTEGQLTVYNYKRGPCYRCLYPKPNATAGSKSCSDNGVLGPVPGIIGIMQAMETLKIITDYGQVMHDRLTMYDSLQCTFLRIKKPPKQKKCPICGPDATIKSMQESQSASEATRGPSCSTQYIAPETPADASISCSDFDRIRRNNEPYILLDVRVKEQYDLCSLKGSINLPLEKLEEHFSYVEELSAGTKTVYCLCRRGIASAIATNALYKALEKYPGINSVKNIEGGLNSWRKHVDPVFPKY